ncbi:hypothetical protein B0T26DRAFT_745110 [Lasiosphaeria miniovina]|uniref:Fungal N-terminal domain-containing protein n=1 Tax=Lasiosphaeria miniovina TaxID=1954250 RepID=A0AA40BF21_9PEZI|nr:uncharacterized protein B0T26DRAFT_745110 [Lasiosphaeria miniovina]KAK0733014.1 hypothetical protein B0T26DRAFT_745110 [Lasiosphaeria miniovina]
MADPLSIAASIAGVAAAGFAAAKGLYEIADGIGSAGVEVRVYGDEVASFSKFLYHVRSELVRSEGVSSEAQSLLGDTVHLYDRILHPFKGMLGTLQPLLARFRGRESKLRQFGLRLQWVFRTKDKLVFYRSALNAQHRLLQTLLDLIILQATRDKSAENIHMLNISLQHSFAATTRGLNETNAPTPQEALTGDSNPKSVFSDTAEALKLPSANADSADTDMDLKAAYLAEEPTPEQRGRRQWFEKRASNADPRGLAARNVNVWDMEAINAELPGYV